MKSMNYDELVVGNKYYIVCGIWRGIYSFAGFHDYPGYRNSVPVFTLGSASEYDKQFNIVDYRSNIKVYEIPDTDETAEQGEPVDVENTSASEQDNTADKRTCETCKYRNIYFRCDCHSSHLFNRDLKYDYSCIFYVNKNHYDDVFRSGG